MTDRADNDAREWEPKSEGLKEAERRLLRLQSLLAQTLEMIDKTRQEIAKLKGSPDPKPGTSES